MSLTDLLFNRSISIGIDIGASSVKLVGITHSNKDTKLKCIALRDVPEDTITNEEITNREALMDTIESLIKDTEREHGIKIKDVIFAITRSASKGIYIDKVKNEKVPPGVNLTNFIGSLTQNRNYANDGEETTFDYKILKKERNENGEEIIDVLITTIKDKIVLPYYGVLKDLGLNPIILDVDVFAVYNVWYSQKKPEDLEDVQLLLHIGEKNSAIILIENGIFSSSRQIAIGASSFISALQNNLNIDRESAIEILKGDIPEEFNEEEIDKMLYYTAEEFSSYLESTFRYFNNEMPKDKSINKLILSGGGATTQGLAVYLERKFGITTNTLNPFDSISIDENFQIAFEERKDFLPLLTVAVGLALRKTEEV